MKDYTDGEEWEKKKGKEEKGEKKGNATPLNDSLIALLRVTGRPPTSETEKTVKRRVRRKAKKVAVLIEELLLAVNTNHSFGDYPLTLRAVLEHLPEGKHLLEEAKTSHQTQVFAQAALEMTASASRTNKGAVLGILSKKNDKGQVKLGAVAAATGFSKSHIKASRRKMTTGDLGAFAAKH